MMLLRRLIDKVMGVELRKMNSAVNDVVCDLNDIKPRIEIIEQVVSKSYNLILSDRDGIGPLRAQLAHVRSTETYNTALSNREPLISVCIATYNKEKELIEVALKSVFEQTYQNFEIIIIGDNCTDDTEKRLKKLNDNRIRFINLPNRGPYPEDPTKRWMVAGAPGVDLAAVLAKGEWIARLDDDDRWTKDHLEKLLKLALKTKSEFVYGALARVNTLTGDSHIVYAETPTFGQISFQGVMYLKCLNFFHYDTQSYLVDEPTDWNLIRRMTTSGVRYASTSDIVGDINWTPNTSKKHR